MLRPPRVRPRLRRLDPVARLRGRGSPGIALALAASMSHTSGRRRRPRGVPGVRPGAARARPTTRREALAEIRILLPTRRPRRRRRRPRPRSPTRARPRLAESRPRAANGIYGGCSSPRRPPRRRRAEEECPLPPPPIGVIFNHPARGRRHLGARRADCGRGRGRAPRRRGSGSGGAFGSTAGGAAGVPPGVRGGGAREVPSWRRVPRRDARLGASGSGVRGGGPPALTRRAASAVAFCRLGEHLEERVRLLARGRRFLSAAGELGRGCVRRTP